MYHLINIDNQERKVEFGKLEISLGDKRWYSLGQIVEFNSGRTIGENTWGFKVEVEDIRVWEVALGVGILQVYDPNTWSFGLPPPKIDIKFSIDGHPYIVEKAFCASKVDWKKMSQNHSMFDPYIAGLEFIKYERNI